MAVTNLWLKEEWEEWKREMEEKRRRRRIWMERVSRWSIVEDNEEMEEKEDDGEETDREDGEVSRDEEENDTEETGEEEDEEEGENEEWKWVKEVRNGDGKEDREALEVEGRVDMEEEENEIEGKVKENKEVDEDEETELDEVDELEEEEEDVQKEAEREAWENYNEDDEEDCGMKEAKEMQEEQEGGESEVEREVEENKEVVTEEEKEVMEAEEYEEEERDIENEMRREVKMNGEVEEVDEEQVMQAEEMEEGWQQGANGFERNIRVNNKEEVRELEQIEEDDEEEDHQEQVDVGHYHFAGRLSKQRRAEDENILRNQESARQGVKTVYEEENLPDTMESSEDSDLTGSEDEYFNFGTTEDNEIVVGNQNKDPEKVRDSDENSWGNENSFLGEWMTTERKEDDTCEKLTDEKETVAESLTTQEEEFLDEEDEECTEDEEEHSAEEDEDNYDDDVIQMYYKDDYITDLFGTLTEFRDSFLLTDLTLITEDGKSFLVHSPVLAAVSSLIHKSLKRGNVEDARADETGDGGLHRWSVSLGPDVNHVGLSAVVEFAYTGHVLCLNKDTVCQIEAAARTLGAPRVLDLCTKEEEKSTITGGQKKEKRISAAEQMMISLQSIRQLWLEKVGCDVILEAVGGSLHVHRVILAASSDYFCSMFTLGMKESHQPCVTLPFLLASELEVLIDCSYSGALPLSWRCVFEITSTALQLQYQPVLSLCLNFLQQEINPHSCLDVASFAEAYEMLQLLEVADDFVLRQFQKVASTSKFKDLPAKKLLRYLNSHSLCVPSELVVFKAVVAWIQAKPKKRLQLAKELMKTIHFPLMTFKEFKEVQSLSMWSDHSLAELYEAIFDDFCSNETAPHHECRIYLPKESLILIGGDQTSEDLGSRSISRELWFGNSLRNHTGIKKAMEWRRLAEMPDSGKFSHEVTVHQGLLYVFGGKKYYGTNDTLNSVYRYDPLQNSWDSLAEMQEKRCSFSVVVLDEKMYAIGGHCDPEHLDSVERYCPIENTWRFTCPLDLPLSAHAAKVLQGRIFISGGLSSDYQCLASMFLYHPETGSTYLANMAKPRAHHCMETVGECLYVAGGITMGDNVTFVDQLACEVYNPVADSWTAFSSLPVPHVGAGSAVLEGKFYVLGGYSHEDYSDTKMVHRFDPSTWRWENMGKMPGPNNDIRAALLYLPTHFRL